MIDLELPENTPSGQARARALDRRHRKDVTPTSLVSFLSHGRVLLVGDESAVTAAAQRLDKTLVPTLMIPADTEARPDTVDGITCIRGGRPNLSGSLGSYTVRFDDGDENKAPAATTLLTKARFDLVLDLCEPPLLQSEVPPPGYFAPRGDEAALDAAITELPAMRGEFEKPKYFNYDSTICAHGRRGIRGCTRCLEVCPAWAITSIGETIEVDPNLCQGFGTCASVCPTGAITYAYPSTGDLLDYVRTTLQRFHEAGGADPLLVFYDSASEQRLADGLAAALPENVLPVALEEVGSLGMDAWLACLAYGAGRILLLTGADSPPSVAETLGREIEVADAILVGMGYPGAAMQLLSSENPDAVVEAAGADGVVVLERAARFVPPPEKSLLLQTAVKHLLDQAPSPKKSVPLPAGASFGRVKVDADACTLCMGCVAVCPAAALREGQGLPQLNFNESCCVQCGLCEKACPEDAITLQPRFLYDEKQRQATRLLHEEQPLCCISCGKPFATRSMLKVMEQKLADHWMFQKDEDRRRLEMCEDCRVKDLMRAQRGGGPTAV